MTESPLETIEIRPEGPHRSTVIWLHGLGANGHDFEPIVGELDLSRDLGVHFVFPHAPVRPITINGGLPMRGWYDVLDLDLTAGEDEEGIRASERAVAALLEREIAREEGVPAGRIVLAGFSQGGAIALQTGLRQPERLGGLLVLSSYLPLAERAGAERSEASLGTPILMAHGELDPIIAMEHGEASRNRLRELGYAPAWKSYSIAHRVCPEEVRDISGWFEEVLS